ncbi:MAG: NAD-dependent epimerase/dehydratase family protein, partial [Planctomycetes bacterium]|nr:NAD-dependent epimerase/dehydratase family protein [Planctomycetota bacterium]
AALAKAVAGAQVIFHFAALTSVAESVERPEDYLNVNNTGTLRVLEAARAAAAPGHRVVYAASSSVYGDRGEIALVETLAPRPASLYAASKCAGEQILSAYAESHGLSCISLRYFNVFGPRQRPDSPYAAVIPRFAEALLAGRRLTVYGDGTQTRDFTHVADAVRANLLAGASERALRGESVNIACGRRSDLLSLIRLMGEILGVEPAYELAPPRAGEVKHSLADITAAGELLGYRPLVSLEKGLKETLAYFAEERT